MVVQVGTSGNARCRSSYNTFITTYKAAYIVPVAVVPFAPPSARKTAHKITAAAIPRLGNKFCIGKNRIFCNCIYKESLHLKRTGRITAKRRSKVKTEAVNVHFHNPVTQAVYDKLRNYRVICIHRISASGKIHIILLFPRRKNIVNGIFKAAETERIPLLVPFGSMVVNNVKNYLKTGLVHLAHKFLELAHRTAGRTVGRISRFWRKKSHRTVAPVI